MNNVKALRLSKGLTQEQLADMIGSNKQYISTLENGKRDIMRIQKATMDKLCKALECTVPELLGQPLDFSQDGRLIIDDIYDYPQMYGCWLIRIGPMYFVMHSDFMDRCDGKKLASKLLYYRDGAQVAKYRTRMTEDLTLYAMYKMQPRDLTWYLDKRKQKRAITQEELGQLRSKYNIADCDITGEFETTDGTIFGSAFAYTTTCIQIKVSGGDALKIVHELKEKKIDASNGARGRVNIRVA